MTTYPNQKVLHINKPNYENAYLSVGINEWIEASKNLKPITFKIYLYLCGNKNGLDLVLSRQNVINKLGISKNSYINGIDELKEKGYIIHKQGNIYDFYTTPMYQSNGTLDDGMYQCSGTSNDGMYQSNGTVCTNTVVHDVPVDEYSMYQSTGTEINNLYNINNLSIDADAKREKKEDLNNKRRLEDLTDEELDNLEYDYKLKVKYTELYKKYNLAERIDNTLLSKIFEIKKDREREYRKQEANERLLKNDDNFYVNPNKAEYVKKTEECLPELESLWYM